MSDFADKLQAKKEAAARARMARVSKGLQGKRIRLEELDEKTDLEQERKRRGVAGFRQEVARYGATEVTEESLRDMLKRDDAVRLPEYHGGED